MSRQESPVVVGVDGAGSSDAAVEWATAEAATRHCPLRIVHALRPPPAGDLYGVVPPPERLGTTRTASRLVLRDAVARARSVASDIEVSTRLLPGPAVRALLDEARSAGLLVLGTRGRSGLRSLLSGSVSVQVAAHAACPVAVIRPTEAARLSPSAPRVVVGVDGSGSCAPAVCFALQAAWQRGVPLVAVHAWTPDPPADLEAICGPAAMAEARGRRLTEHALDSRRNEFAGVPVVTKLVHAHPARALVVESAGAALIVVGSRGRGPLLGTVLGSISQSVLHDVRCPIAIVRHCEAPAAASPRHARRRFNA